MKVMDLCKFVSFLEPYGCAIYLFIYLFVFPSHVSKRTFLKKLPMEY